MPRVIRLLCAALIFALGLASADAAADPASPDPAAAELTLTRGNGIDPAVAKSVTLSCAPEIGGTHPDSRDACAALDRDNADFDHLPHIREGMCPLVWDPVSVTATGRWHGRTVGYRHTYANSCVAANESAAVFAF